MKKAGLAFRLLLVMGLAALAGCATLTPDPVPARVQLGGVDTDVKALQEWRQEARLEQESQARDIEQLRKQLKDLESAFREHQQSVRVQIQDLEVARERDKKEIVDELAKKLATMQSVLAPPAPSPAAQKSGYEHVVKAGENLSEIAKAYKVSLDAILKANQLKDGNQIRVGQKLFIPD
jgi:LysM repeat protein